MNHRRGGILITQIHQLSGRIFARKLKAWGITEINPAQGRILFALWEQDMIPINELSRRTQLKKSTLTSMLERLQTLGYIVRTLDPDDHRRIIISRTDKDRALQEAYAGVSEEMLALFYNGMAEREIDRFEASLERILANLGREEGG